VIAGTARGLRLAAPGDGTRPLSDRAKQTIFAILEPDLDGARVLDLFAGSGAAGIEALSRGAAEAVFVDLAGDACRTIAENLRRAGLADRGRVVRADAIAFLGGPAVDAGPFDVVLVDPPYPQPELLRTAIEVLAREDLAREDFAKPLLAPGARVVARAFWRDGTPGSAGLLASERERRLGESVLAFYRRSAGEEESGG
jgi:16S rRNA (guanine(966)-N(2))-methyltransferase RsmD